MARVVICPSCQSKGAVPENAQIARVRCPKCGVVFDGGANTPRPGSASTSAARKAPSPTGTSRASVFDDLDSVESEAKAVPASGRGAIRGKTPSGSDGKPPVLLYALLGVSGLAVILLGLVVVILLSRGDGGSAAPAVTVASTVKPDADPRVPQSAGDVVTPTRVAAVSSENTPPSSGITAVVASASLPASAAPSAGSPPDPQEIVRRLKDATVFIKNKLGGRTVSTGSGFVIELEGDRVLIATNRHVAVPDLSGLPPGVVPMGTQPTIEAVFRSGQGKEEQDLPAQIVAADLSQESQVDLAFLVVKGVKQPPKPIDTAARITPTEGMTYIGAGFPLGGMLTKVTEGNGNPSVTITGGRLSALRRDAYGQLALLQVDGSLQPGNSGGPIIDEKSGKLLGVAVAKVNAVDTIGFVVLAEEVRRALAGRFGSFDLALESLSQQGVATLQVKALLVDPHLQVGSVVVHAAPALTLGKLSPDSDGVWSPLPNTKPFELQRDARTPVATGKVEVAINGSGVNARKILIQAAHRDFRGRLFYSKPQEVLLPDQPGRVMPAGQLATTIKAFRGKSLTLLGPLIDPAKDCRLDKDDQNFKLKIDIPGKLHTLSPKLTARSTQAVNNAPMTLTDVEGDFAVFVEITGDINPGSTPPKEKQAQGIPFTYQSAGLILYQDKNNYFRLERGSSVLINNLRPLHALFIQAVKDGKAIDPITFPMPEGDIMLILVKRKGRVRCMFSPDGGRSGAKFRELALDLPPKVKVGLCASNISAQPFTANFENFSLLSDVTKLDQQLGD